MSCGPRTEIWVIWRLPPFFREGITAEYYLAAPTLLRCLQTLRNVQHVKNVTLSCWLHGVMGARGLRHAKDGEG
jgi:hypothetical protein